MLKSNSIIAASIAVAIVAAIATPAFAQTTRANSTSNLSLPTGASLKNQSNTSADVISESTNSTTGASQFKMAMRDLWMDHIVYTRLVIVSFANNLPDYNATADRLLQNQVDLGNAIKPYYGDSAGSQLTALLKQHVLTAVDVLKAVKSNDTQALATANKTWYDNADQIATFFSNATDLPKQSVLSMMDNYLTLTTQEAVARLHGNYTADIAAFDAVHKQVLMMSDSLANAIIKQFPDRFTGVETTVASSNSTASTGSVQNTTTFHVSIVPNAPLMDGKAFSPSPLNITAGATVVWTNTDNIAHTVTSDSGLFNSGPIAPHHTFQHTFTTAGKFPYHCEIHPQMKGQVVVS
ncbi:MAG: cupredoxin domain-containing protein [Nitrososphaera sp.]|jgi:plastocyanin